MALLRAFGPLPRIAVATSEFRPQPVTGDQVGGSGFFSRGICPLNRPVETCKRSVAYTGSVDPEGE